MFDQTSRYYKLNPITMTVTDRDNGQPRVLAYVPRRFIPSPEGLTVMTEYRVKEADRLDNIAAQYMGDPTLFWKICDANVVFQPESLTDTVGNVFVITLPRL